jgi:2-succinyl-6-hydroxy-2,4-cyclohexadiene-1-carboxylate synthase
MSWRERANDVPGAAGEMTRMPLIDVPDARLWYDDTGGDGVPVVFVHPAAADSRAWEAQLPAFVAAGYRCVTYDLRGWGRSRQRPDGSGPDAADNGCLSDDLDALAQHLGLGRFMLVAAAYGGMGALDFALRFQDRVRAFVLATSQGAVVDAEYVAVLDRVFTPELRALPIELRELGPSYRAEDPAGVARWLEIVHQAGAETARRQRRHLTLTLALLETLRVPTLVLAADADLLAPPALMRLLAARIPSSELALVADAGHSAHWERPADWNRIVLGFLGRQ